MAPSISKNAIFVCCLLCVNKSLETLTALDRKRVRSGQGSNTHTRARWNSTFLEILRASPLFLSPRLDLPFTLFPVHPTVFYKYLSRTAAADTFLIRHHVWHLASASSFRSRCLLGYAEVFEEGVVRWWIVGNVWNFKWILRTLSTHLIFPISTFSLGGVGRLRDRWGLQSSSVTFLKFQLIFLQLLVMIDWELHSHNVWSGTW